jgi:MFS family permease
MSAEPKHDEYPSPAYAWYVVGVLTLAYVFSFIDRQILSLLVKPIQRDLEITDTQMSLLMGLSFAVFYTFFGIPLGRLADTRSRRTIVSLGIAFWSVATAGCGLARKFWELAVMRMGVGIGEATLSPAAYSLIADYFPPQRRSTAMGVYSMGIYVGSGLAFILGGLVARLASNQESYVVPLVGSIRSWQLVFFVVGLPGLLVALLLLTVAEPSRKGLHAARPSASLRETWAYLCENGAALVCLNCGIALVTLNSYASTSWIPTLFERRFGWNQGSIGLVYGAIVGVCGTMGVVAGGWWADRWSRHGCTDAPLRVAWLATLCGLPCTILYPLARSGEWTALLLVPMVFCGSMPFGVAPAAIQRMMPNTMRAQATAIYLFVINLIGMGMGPTLVALGTEHVFHDKNSVHHSLLIVGTLSYLCAGVLLGISLKRYRRSLEHLDAWIASRADQACPAPT